MSEVLRKKYLKITSDVAAAVNSAEFRVGGNIFDAQVVAPASLVEMQVSGDKLNWVTALDSTGTPLTALGSGFYDVANRADWMRAQVALDAGGPQTFSVIVGTHKQGGNG